MIGLDQVAVVYVENPATGAYDSVANAALACRLLHLSLRAATSGSERAELAAIRTLIWDPSYVLPEEAQLVVDGVRWNTVPGSFAAHRGPAGQVTYRRCDVIRDG